MIRIAISIVIICSASFGYQKRILTPKTGEMLELTIRPGWVTVINLPVRPSDVVRGSKSVSVKFQDSDLLVSPVRHPIRSNLIVYAGGFRYLFNLRTTVGERFDEIVLVRHKEPKANSEKVNIPYVDEKKEKGK